MATSFDAIVIGAGPNGLVTAALLAKSGMKVTVLERRPAPGGIASSVEFAPGVHGSVGPDLCLLPRRLVEALSLETHGLRLHAPDPIVFAPTRDGRALSLWRDPVKTQEEIRRLSALDAAAWPRFGERVHKLVSFLRPIAEHPPPVPEVQGVADLLALLKLGWDFRRMGAESMHELLRALPMPVADFLGEWFESEPLKAVLAGPGLRGVSFGPRAAGTAAHFLFHQIGDDGRPWHSERLPVGGMKALVDALVSSAKAQGAQVRTGADVRRIEIRDGRAVGVRLDDGEVLGASRVVSSAAPRTTLLELVDPDWLEPRFVGEVRAIRYRGVQAKLLLALSELPDFRAQSGTEKAPHHGAVIHIGDSLDELEQASDAAKYGEPSARPFLLATIPSVLDPSAAPPGQHVLSVTAQYAPYGLRKGSWTERAEALAETILERLAEVAPNVPGAVLHRRLITPLDYETEYGLPEGSVLHGEMALDQMLFMRPVPGWSRYRTPVEGLYLCGSGCHPGGGVTGLPGLNASRVILSRR
jgi:phytoene dehydrogenase-like protein